MDVKIANSVRILNSIQGLTTDPRYDSQYSLSTDNIGVGCGKRFKPGEVRLPSLSDAVEIFFAGIGHSTHPNCIVDLGSCNTRPLHSLIAGTLSGGGRWHHYWVRGYCLHIGHRDLPIHTKVSKPKRQDNRLHHLDCDGVDYLARMPWWKRIDLFSICLDAPAPHPFYYSDAFDFAYDHLAAGGTVVGYTTTAGNGTNPLRWLKHRISNDRGFCSMETFTTGTYEIVVARRFANPLIFSREQAWLWQMR